MAWAITGALIMGGMTAYQIQQQNEAATAQQESIAATTRMNYALKQQQEQELKEQAGMDLTSEAIKRYQERGKIQAAQGESGVAGASPLRELANSYLQQSLTAGSIISKSEAGQRSLALENQSTYLQGLSQINQLQSQKTTGFDAALQIGLSAGAGALMGGALGGAGGATATTGSAVGTVPKGATFFSNVTGQTYVAGQSVVGLGGGTLTTASTGLVGGMTSAQQMALGSMLGSYSTRK